MKKFIIVLFIALLSSGIYVSAKSITEPTYNIADSNTNVVQRFYQQRVASHFNQHYFTPEEHEEILLKRIELTLKYLTNYDLMSSEEKQLAEDQYNSSLNAFILELTGNSIDFENQMGGRVLSRVDSLTHELIVSKRIELTLKHFSDYSSLTAEDKMSAFENYRIELREFMKSVMNEYNQNCQGFGSRNRQGSRFGRNN